MTFIGMHILPDIIPYTASHLKDRKVVEARQRLTGNESSDLYVPLQSPAYPSVFPMNKSIGIALHPHLSALDIVLHCV